MASSPPRPRRQQPATRRQLTSPPRRLRTDPDLLEHREKGGPRAAFFVTRPHLARQHRHGPLLPAARALESGPSCYRQQVDSGRFMTETADELSAPLGQKTERRKRRFRLPFTAMQALAVLLGLFLVAFLTVALFTDNPFGGEPVARIALRQLTADEKLPGPEKAAKSVQQAATGDNKTVTIIDGSSGKRQDIVIGSDAGDKSGAEPATTMAGIDARLLEKSRYG